MRGGVLAYAAQGNPPPDAEIAKNRRFRTRTSLHFSLGVAWWPRRDGLAARFLSGLTLSGSAQSAYGEYQIGEV